MSGRLVGEVADWLCTPAATGMTPGERAVLLTIAERVNEKDPERRMLRHRTDEVTLFERLCLVTGIDRAGMTEVLKKLAKRDLEVRIEVRKTAAGKPIFAYRGHSMEFRLPVLPASLALPESIGPDRPNPVDNPVDEPVDSEPEEPPSDSESIGPDRPKDPKGSADTDAFAGKGRSQPIPKSFNGGPSNYSPSTPMDPSSVVTVEDAPPTAATPPATTSHHMGWEPDYREARDFLFGLAREGQEFMDAATEHLGPNAPIADRVIHAAQAAHHAREGIPA